MTLRTLAAGRHASLEEGFAFGFSRVPAQPVARAGEFPCGSEIARVLLEPRLPDLGRLSGAGDLLAPRVERIRAVVPTVMRDFGAAGDDALRVERLRRCSTEREVQ